MVIQVPLQVKFENNSELFLKYYPIIQINGGFYFNQEAHCTLFCISPFLMAIPFDFF